MTYKEEYLKLKNLTIKNKAFLAPMAGVTDELFRKMVRKWSKDCLIFTEMINATMFVTAKKVSSIVKIIPEDYPIAYQFSGDESYYFAKAAERAQKLGAVAVDLNMACPMPLLVRKGHGASLLKSIELAREIIEETVKSVDIPVTLKMRTGWDDSSIIVKEFVQMAEESGISAITIHGRTREQQYQGPVNLDLIKEAQEIASIPIMGSGDIWSPADAKRMMDYTKCVAVWVARGSIGRPWIVAQIDNYLRTGIIEPKITNEDMLDSYFEHLELMIEDMDERGGIQKSRRHFKYCVRDMQDNKEFIHRINVALTKKEVIETLNDYKKHLAQFN